MKTKLIEATAGPQGNHGKFLLMKHDKEWQYASQIKTGYGLGSLEHEGWTPNHLWVMDLATGEGALFRHGGYAKADLDKHRVWVCPLFEPFLQWLYEQDVKDLDALPALVELDIEKHPLQFQGYRRPGPEGSDE